MKLKFIKIIIFLSSFALSMKQSDFCLNKNKQCKGFNSFMENRYSVKCEQLNCQGDYSYECENDFCSSSQKTCKKFFQLNKLKESLQTYLAAAASKYIYFTSVKECPTVKYELKNYDVCVNTKSCMYMERMVTLEANKNGKKYLLCPCSGKLSYHCGQHHCSIHNLACDAFKANSFSIKMKRCTNFNIFAQKKLILI